MKKKPFKNPAEQAARKAEFAPQHPAQQAAESDLIKLTREFESLTSQLANLDEQFKALDDDDYAASINYEMGMKQRYKRREAILRQRRLLQAQFDNVQELLANATRSKVTGQCLTTMTASVV